VPRRGGAARWAPELDRFIVHDVAADSPASEAGLRTGDAIVAIDDQAADRFRIGQVRTMLSRAGTTHQFTVVRGQQTASLTLHTRRRL
jgi:S1-C subfamily serine protease